MPRADRDERVPRLAAYRKRRSAEAFIASKRAIDHLRATDDAINYATVAVRAGVSISYLQKNAELRSQIQKYMRHVRQRPASTGTETIMLAGLRNRLKLVSERNQELEREISQLRKKNEALKGEVVFLQRQVRRGL